MSLQEESLSVAPAFEITKVRFGSIFLLLDQAGKRVLDHSRKCLSSSLSLRSGFELSKSYLSGRQSNKLVTLEPALLQ